MHIFTYYALYNIGIHTIALNENTINQILTPMHCVFAKKILCWRRDITTEHTIYYSLFSCVHYYPIDIWGITTPACIKNNLINYHYTTSQTQRIDCKLLRFLGKASTIAITYSYSYRSLAFPSARFMRLCCRMERR